MEIRYERPLPDLSFMVRAPLKMDIGGGQVAWIDAWCPEGLRPPDYLTGDDGTARISIPFQGFEITFLVRMQRDTASGMMRFVDLGTREQRVLNHFYREIVTGRAVSMDRMITAMDTPVELVPMHQTPKEIAVSKARTKPRMLRAAAVLAFYAGLIALLYEPVLNPVWQQARALTAHAVQVVAPQPEPEASVGEGAVSEVREIGFLAMDRP